MARYMEISMYLAMKHMARYMEISMYLATKDIMAGYMKISMYLATKDMAGYMEISMYLATKDMARNMEISMYLATKDMVGYMAISIPFFFFNDTATTEIYTLSLHDALPIWKFPCITQAIYLTCKHLARHLEIPMYLATK